MTLKSAQVGGEVFLQGKYFSIGVNSDGGLGTQNAAPTGFESDLAAGFKRTGLFADLDGFNTGKATTLHDAVLPGRTIEGFNVGYKINGAKVVQSNQQLTGFSQITGSAANASTAAKAEADWTGNTSDKLNISQKLMLTDDAKFIRIDVTLKNGSAATMSDVRYMRTADPDQGSTFVTENKIVQQGAGSALVASYTGGANPFFLYSSDARARVSTYGFVNTDPYAAAAYDAAQEQGYSKKADQTVNITFAVGTLAAGQSTTLTLYMGVTDNLDATLASIHGLAVPDLAPIALADIAGVIAGETVTGNVLTNDRDPEGASLKATLKTNAEHGTVKLNSDGSFSYVADSGFSGVDTFTYSASDGKLASTAAVSVTVTAPAPTPPPPPTPKPTPSSDPLLTRAGTVDGSAATSDILTGAGHHNSFFFKIAATSGADKITNFAADDVFVTDKALYDGNGDGIIALSKARVFLDAPKAGDSVTISGVSSLRSLGVDSAGNYVYGDGAVRPKGGIEGKLSNDVLTGDGTDKGKQTFFFDTALDTNLGSDRVNNFGAKDILVTTSALDSSAAGSKLALSGGIVKLPGGSDGPGDVFKPGEGGTVELHGTSGALVSSIEFDGSVIHDGTTYFVYSLAGSSAGLADLGF